jgi:hypothetical protein
MYSYMAGWKDVDGIRTYFPFLSAYKFEIGNCGKTGLLNAPASNVANIGIEYY